MKTDKEADVMRLKLDQLRPAMVATEESVEGEKSEGKTSKVVPPLLLSQIVPSIARTES